MAAGSTYTPIATTTLGSAQTTISFTSISGSYTDLVLVLNIAGVSNAGELLRFQVNSDTGSNYSATSLANDGNTAASGRISGSTWAYFGGDNQGVKTGTSLATAQFMNYSNATTYKTVLTRFNQAADSVGSVVNLWRSTSAITSIQVFLNTAKTYTFSSGTTATLYGIQAA